MFKIGDKIVYPLHGAGVVEDIEEKEVLGEVRKYYILRMPIHSMKISVPVDIIGEMGVREIFSMDKYPLIIEILEGKSSSMPDNWTQRYKENLDKIKTGDIEEIAIVVRNLSIREDNKGLSTGEKKMLNSAKKVLVSEIVMATGKDIDEVYEIIDNAIYNFKDS